MISFEKLREQIFGVRKGVAAIRRELEEKRQRVEYLERAPLAADEALAIELEHVDRCEAFFRENLTQHAAQHFAHDPATECRHLEHMAGPQFPIVSNRHGVRTAVDPRLLVGCLAPQVREAVKAAFATQKCWPRDCGPPRAERNAEAAKLRTEIEKLEEQLAEAKNVAQQEGIRL